MTDPTHVTTIPQDLQRDQAIRRVVYRIVAEHPGLPNEEVLTRTRAQLLEEPASRAEVFAALLALEEAEGR
jgi:hypothetical protein